MPIQMDALWPMLRQLKHGDAAIVSALLDQRITDIARAPDIGDYVVWHSPGRTRGKNKTRPCWPVGRVLSIKRRGSARAVIVEVGLDGVQLDPSGSARWEVSLFRLVYVTDEASSLRTRLQELSEVVTRGAVGLYVDAQSVARDPAGLAKATTTPTATAPAASPPEEKPKSERTPLKASVPKRKGRFSKWPT